MVTKNKDDWVNVRITGDMKQGAQRLIDSGKYENMADFIRECIADKLDPSRKESEIAEIMERLLRDRPEILAPVVQRIGIEYFVKKQSDK